MDKAKEQQFVEKENPYAGIEISAGELGLTEQSDAAGRKTDEQSAADALKEGVQQATEKKEAGSGAAESTDSPAKDGDEKEGEEAQPKVEIDGQEYDKADILEALQDRQNKKKWQSESTQRDQETAALRKAVEPVVQLVQKLREKGEVAQNIREDLMEEFGDEIAPIVDAALAFDPEKHPNPYEKDLEAKDRRIAELESDEILRKEKDALTGKYKLKPAAVEEVVQYAVKYYEETGAALGLEEAYKLWDYDELAKKRTGTPPPPVVKGNGAREIKKKAPVPKTYANIDLSEYKLTE